ncbi:SDR family NAD(P)-dependent oxidoreductase [Novosphingobium piscinae]|uniref:SDR family NAD(P)-dependent oxidoreductase n=1 Tax=Novosphingobium piscinae TaxID=1507448 RepID=A0A7X1FWK0_9SPHN|nr:SDR family NAD(P)-dependent oxidoreductase [Novosphingobium piscinae]MBC2667667.1 SDR family NAD(P)-dependent oxidoreductase [Novosphingobium piscinae]
MGRLDGKVAVVTGASRGIGKGIALALAADGATVYVTGRTASPGSHPLPGTVGETAAQCTQRGGQGIAVQCDHADHAQVARLFDQVRAEQGRLDILVNNAFVIPDDLLEPRGFWDKPLSNLEMIDVGVTSNFVAAWHAARLMVPQGSGLIVAISGYAAVTYTYGVLFGTSKTAVGRMTRDMAIELEPHGVAAVTLWQGLTLTERARDNLARVADKMTRSITGQKGSSVEHPGRVIAALACDPQIMRRSGGEFITAEIARDYGVTDDDGTWVESMRAQRGAPLWAPIAGDNT